MRRNLLAVSLALATASSGATDYYLVTPVPEKQRAIEAATTVSLQPYALPAATVGAAYSVDLRPLLQVTGDPAYSPAQVVWTLAAGTLPAGLTLGVGGVLSGSPTVVGNQSFSVKATFKTKSGVQTYAISAALAVNFAPTVSSLQFDTVPVGESSSKSVVVSNTGSAALTLTGYTVPSGYTASSNCNSVVPGASCQVAVTFKPTAQQNYLGNLTLTAQGYPSDKVVSLVGAGSAPNFATLDPATRSLPLTISLSADKLSASGASNLALVAASKPKTSGKWYFEGQLPSGTLSLCKVGLMPTANTGTAAVAIDGLSDAGASYAVQTGTSDYQINRSTYYAVDWQGGATIQNQWVGVAYDLDNMTVRFVLPNRTVGPFPLSKPVGTSYVPAISIWNGCTMRVNFGQTPFQRSVPAGFNAGLF